VLDLIYDKENSDDCKPVTLYSVMLPGIASWGYSAGATYSRVFYSFCGIFTLREIDYEIVSLRGVPGTSQRSFEESLQLATQHFIAGLTM
jgi:hypothetical protein